MPPSRTYPPSVVVLELCVSNVNWINLVVGLYTLYSAMPVCTPWFEYTMSKDEILDSLFGWKGKKSCSVDADFQKRVIWEGVRKMKFRASLSTSGNTGYERAERTGQLSGEQEIILIIKKHPLQTEWDENEQEFTAIHYVMLRKPCWRKNR